MYNIESKTRCCKSPIYKNYYTIFEYFIIEYNMEFIFFGANFLHIHEVAFNIYQKSFYSV